MCLGGFIMLDFTMMRFEALDPGVGAAEVAPKSL